MIILYRVLTLLLYFLLYPYGRMRAAFGDVAWRGRLALNGTCRDADIWLHAASVGEVRVIGYLIDYLTKKRPSLKLHVTVMTRAGYETANSLLGDSVSLSFLPLDVSRLQSRAVARIQPKVLVIAETEIWPNLILAASKRNIPVMLVNGRMTDGALVRYLRFKRLFKDLLSRYDRILAKSDEDRERFLRLDVSPNICEMGGDMKFDAPLTERSEVKRRQIRESLGIAPEQFLLVAGSTREGEEKLVMEIYKSVKKDFSHLRLVVAPRHMARLAAVEEIIRTVGTAVRRYSVEGERSSNDVLLVDQMGLLNDMYLAADLAFVGGTLVEIGGHNLLEPVWAGTPVLYGPSVSNVREAAEYIGANRFGKQVSDAAELEKTVRQILRNEISFRIKTTDDISHSPTAHAGDYILRKLDRA